MTLTATKLASSPTVCTSFCCSVRIVASWLQVEMHATRHNSFVETSIVVARRMTICHLTGRNQLKQLKALATSIRAMTVLSSSVRSFHLVIDETI